MSRGLTALLILAFMFAWSSTKLSLPALPVIAGACAVSDQTVRLSVGLFYLAYAGGQLP